MTKHIYSFTLSEDDQGARLDALLAKHIPSVSRSQIQHWIKNHELRVNGQTTTPNYRIKGGESIEISAEGREPLQHEAEPLKLPIHYEDEAVLIINKPAGLVVHPGAGQPNSTLLNALLHHHAALRELPRAGIVHRLDKDTTGLMVVAKTPEALHHLTKQLKHREIERYYQAVVYGHLISGSTIDAPISRHPIQRKKMSVQEDGKPAVTHYRIIKRFRAFTHVLVKLETGRTHQIRVHFSHIHHPLCGDRVYGGRLTIPKNTSPELTHALRHFNRQALHACQLQFTHPTTEEWVNFESELPSDMTTLLDRLEQNEHAST